MLRSVEDARHRPEPHDAILRRAPRARRKRSAHRGTDQFVGRGLPKRRNRVGVDTPKAARSMHGDRRRQAVGRRPNATEMAFSRIGRMPRMRTVVLIQRRTPTGLGRPVSGLGCRGGISSTPIGSGKTALADIASGTVRNARTCPFFRLARQATYAPCERHGGRRAGDEIRQQAGE